jgi:hypothetical protein
MHTHAAYGHHYAMPMRDPFEVFREFFGGGGGGYPAWGGMDYGARGSGSGGGTRSWWAGVRAVLTVCASLVFSFAPVHGGAPFLAAGGAYAGAAAAPRGSWTMHTTTSTHSYGDNGKGAGWRSVQTQVVNGQQTTVVRETDANGNETVTTQTTPAYHGPAAASAAYASYPGIDPGPPASNTRQRTHQRRG